MRRRYARGQASAWLAARLLRDRTGRQHALLTGRAAAGLWAALRALDIQNQPVGIPANTCYIVLWAVLYSGSTPVLLDVDPQTANLSLASLAAAPPLAAIVPAHLYGLPAPMEAITVWASQRHMLVIEDAAQAVGAHVDGRPVGAWGEVSIVSFGQGKIIDNALGGALLTDDARLAADIAQLLAAAPEWNEQHAQQSEEWSQLYWALHQFETQNPRLAALYPPLFDLYRELIVYRLPPSYWADLPDSLSQLPANLQARAAIAALYDDALSAAPVTPLPHPAGTAIWRYSLLTSRRDELLRQLWQDGFHEVTRWYPSLRPMLAALRPDLSIPPTPNADHLDREIINLPVDIPGEQAARLAQAIHRFFD